MDISPYIQELLFGHDCVIVPGFGGFIGNYLPARIDKGTEMMIPPSRRISFNRNLTHNDGLLISRISESFGINYNDARNMVSDYSASLHRKAERGDRLLFEGVGVIYLDNEGNLQFEPGKEVNFYLGSYGLESFQYLPVDHYDIRKRVLPVPEISPGQRITLRKMLWRAAVIIPAASILVAVTFLPGLFRTKVDSSTMNPIVTEEFENNRKAIEEKAATVEIPTDQPAVAPVSKPVESVNETPGVTVSQGQFSIITGSFKSEENARLQAEMLQKEGFTPEVELLSNGFYRVCAMTCNDSSTAERKKDSIQARYPGTWIKGE